MISRSFKLLRRALTGVALTVIVAWVFVAAPASTGTSLHSGAECYPRYKPTEAWPAEPPTGWPERAADWWITMNAGSRQAVFASEDHGDLCVMTDAGWPLKCFQATLWMSKHRSPVSDGWVQLPGWCVGRRSPTISLPIKPLWLGFGINSVVLGVGTGVLMAAPRWTRRRIRMAQGRCASCGYDLKGLSGGVCPECGEGNTHAARPHSGQGDPTGSPALS